MSSDGFTCRDVCRQDGFDGEAAKIFGSVKAADEILADVEFLLARAPVTYARLAVQRGELRVYAIRSRHTPKWPAVTIFYTCDDQIVTLVGIRRANDSPGEG